MIEVNSLVSFHFKHTLGITIMSRHTGWHRNTDFTIMRPAIWPTDVRFLRIKGQLLVGTYRYQLRDLVFLILRPSKACVCV